MNLTAASVPKIFFFFKQWIKYLTELPQKIRAPIASVLASLRTA